MKTTTTIFFLIILLSSILVNSQNLIKNGSFEDYPYCPKERRWIEGVTGWGEHNQNNCFYYNKCFGYNVIGDTIIFNDKHTMISNNGVPFNQHGYQKPVEGDCYIGMLVTDGGNAHRKVSLGFVQIRLAEKLIKGQNYKVVLYASLQDYQYRASNGISIVFNNKELRNRNSSFISRLTTDQIIDDSINWTKLEWIYAANGLEEFIAIGAFLKEHELKFSKLTFNEKIRHFFKPRYYKWSSYISAYYIDNISCTPVDENGNEIILHPDVLVNNNLDNEQKINIDNAPVGSGIILNNIYFAFNDSTLIDSSYTELNKLYNTLRVNKQLVIEIGGHTDNIGKAEYNLMLSEARARAVVNYLINKGIKPTRLMHKGYGSTIPITGNNNDYKRSKNRRVEFKILKK